GNLLNGGIDIRRLPQHLDRRVERRPQPRPEDGVVIDDEHAGHDSSYSSGVSRCRCTSVPTSPDPGRTVAEPPARCIRPMIDSRPPSRSAGRESRSTPGPRSRTNTSTADADLSISTETSPPAWRAALSIASRAAATRAVLLIPGSPTVTTSILVGY